MRRLINRILGMFGSAFADTKLELKLRLRHVLIQKVLRINAHVPWPVHWTSQIKSCEKIDRGTRFSGLALGVYLDGRNGIIFGENVWIGPRVSIISMDHDTSSYQEFIRAEPVVIGNNCWLATNVVILPGVRLGNHVLCAAGAVVNRSFEEDNILLAGVPARIAKRLEPYRDSQPLPPEKVQQS